MQPTVYSAAGVAVDAFEVEIEVHDGRGNTHRAALDSPIDKQQKQGELEMSVKEIRQLRTQIMMTALALSIRKGRTLAKAVDFIPRGPSGRLTERSPVPPGQDITKVPVSMLDG